MCAPSLDPMTPRAEVIDAWGMTVTPLVVTFTLRPRAPSA